jgi:hypothetical protein
VAAFPSERAADACDALARRGIPARVIGRAEAGTGVVRSDGSPLPAFPRDEVARVLSGDGDVVGFRS